MDVKKGQKWRKYGVDSTVYKGDMIHPSDIHEHYIRKGRLEVADVTRHGVKPWQ